MRAVSRSQSARYPHAFRIPTKGEPERLTATAPPMGLGPGPVAGRYVAWEPKEDLLALWTDGLVEARAPSGEMFGEQRLLDILLKHHSATPDEIVAKVFEAHEQFTPNPGDDRTLVVLRI